MSRILLCLLIWGVFLGAYAMYIRQRDAAAGQRTAAVVLTAASGAYVLEITPSGRLVPDPYALADAPSSLSVLANGRTLLSVEEPLSAGEPFEIPLVGVVEGVNEVCVKASPDLTAVDRRAFLQLRVLSDGSPVADTIVWSEAGGGLVACVPFVVRGEDAANEH